MINFVTVKAKLSPFLHWNKKPQGGSEPPGNDAGEGNNITDQSQTILPRHIRTNSRSPVPQVPAGDIDTHQIDNNTITRQISGHSRNASDSTVSSVPAEKLVIYIPPSPNPDGKVSSPTSSGLITPWFKRQHLRFSSHYHRHSPSSPKWFRVLTCCIPLDHLAKFILTLGLTQAGMALLWGSSKFIQQSRFRSLLVILFPAIQIAWGVFYSAVCVFGMSVMWGGFRKSPAAVLCFMILNCLTSVILITMCVMWFYFSWRWKEAKEDRCYGMTFPAGPGLNAPMRPAPPWAVDECLSARGTMNLWMVVWGTVHGVMFYLSVILSFWAWRYWQLVKKFAVRDRSAHGDSPSHGLQGRQIGDRYISLHDGETGVAADGSTPRYRTITPEGVPMGQAIPMSFLGEVGANTPSLNYSPALMSSASRASQFFPVISTIRDSLGTLESDKHKSTIIIGNAIFRLAPPKTSPALSSPASSRTTATSPLSPPVSARSAGSSSSPQYPPNSPLPKSPLPRAPLIRTIDASMAGVVLPSPMGGFLPLPTNSPTTLKPVHQPSTAAATLASAGVLAVGGFEFPIAPTGPANRPKQNNNTTITTTASTLSPGVPPVPPLPRAIMEKSQKQRLMSVGATGLSSPPQFPPQQQQHAGVVRGKANGFPVIPVRRGTGVLSVGPAPGLLSGVNGGVGAGVGSGAVKVVDFDGQKFVTVGLVV